jgi:hypothetical protein
MWGLDIACCKGVKDDGQVCPKRDACFRYTSKKGQIESWFMEAPFKENGECEHFMSNKARDEPRKPRKI